MTGRAEDEPLDPRVEGLPHAATAAIHEHAQWLAADGRRVHQLGLGRSPFPVPPHVVAALREHAAEKDYLPARGLHALRRAVAHYTERTAGIDRTADDVLIGPGSKALLFLLQLAYGGELIVPTPCWGPIAPQARLLGRTPRFVDTRFSDGWRLMPDALDALCRTLPTGPRMLWLSYPGNPTGATYKPDTLRALARVAQEHDLLVLSDETYGELHHKGQHVSLARYHPDGTILSGGLSKWCGAEGWRLGTMVFPERSRRLLDAMSSAMSETFTATSAPIQHAAVTAFEGGDAMDHYLLHSRRILSALGRWCARQLRQSGIECPQPTGGFYLFPDFSPLAEPLRAAGISTSRQLTARLLADTGIAALPGSDFGRPADELTARLAYVDFDGARALEAVAVIPLQQPLDAVFLKRHCTSTFKAVERLVAWLERHAVADAFAGDGPG